LRQLVATLEHVDAVLQVPQVAGSAGAGPWLQRQDLPALTVELHAEVRVDRGLPDECGSQPALQDAPRDTARSSEARRRIPTDLRGHCGRMIGRAGAGQLTRRCTLASEPTHGPSCLSDPEPLLVSYCRSPMKLALDSRIDSVLHFTYDGVAVSDKDPHLVLEAPPALLLDMATA
jgi:hypothetical protein